jgi:FAD/FMN-containing dehydrogenase
MRQSKMKLGWNQYPVPQSIAYRPERHSQIKPDVHPLIARGCGRSCGDTAVNTDRYVVMMERLNRFLEFDPREGILRAEAGATLRDVLELSIPHGWFLPVTPSTKQSTLGGCIATDTYGFNHLIAGTFSKHVKAIELILADGTKRKCAPKQDPHLFWATVGGMGLTGIISEVTLKLLPIESAYMVVQNYKAENLDELLEIMTSKDKEDVYSLARIDCSSTGNSLGRGIVMNAHHATIHELPLNVQEPFKFKARTRFDISFNYPSFLINRWSLKLLNDLYYRYQSQKTGRQVIDYERYFYPFDSIINWQRIYGVRGFIRYQCVVPANTASESLKLILNETSSYAAIAVLHRLGKAGLGMLSYPREGFALTVDIPRKNRSWFERLKRLDDIVASYEGRVHLAKETGLNQNMFKKMYPRLDEWLLIKSEVDPHNSFSSNFSRRLGMVEGV